MFTHIIICSVYPNTEITPVQDIGRIQLPTGNISNAVMDRCFNLLLTDFGHDQYYALDNFRPVFATSLSTQASLDLTREYGVRDDVRRCAVQDEELRKNGVDSAFRGFLHLWDAASPRFVEKEGYLSRVPCLLTDGSVNSEYIAAEYEAFYVLHKGYSKEETFAPIKDQEFFPETENRPYQYEWTGKEKGFLGLFKRTAESAK